MKFFFKFTILRLKCKKFNPYYSLTIDTPPSFRQFYVFLTDMVRFRIGEGFKDEPRVVPPLSTIMIQLEITLEARDQFRDANDQFNESFGWSERKEPHHITSACVLGGDYINPPL
jgi:hypothetical protein